MRKRRQRQPSRVPEIVSLNDELFSQVPGIEALDDLDRRLALALAAADDIFCDTFTCGSYSCSSFSCGTYKIKP